MAKLSKGKELSRILVRLKISRKQNCRTQNLKPKDIDAFCDDVCALYQFIDQESIETLDRIKI